MKFDHNEGDIIDFDISVQRIEYQEMHLVWDKMRAARRGSIAVKAAGELFLPKLNPKQSKVDYDKFKNGAIWYGATGITVESFKNMIMRKNPVLQADKELFDPSDLASVTQEGESYIDLIAELIDEILTVNRVGVLEDFPDLSGKLDANVSQLDFDKLGIQTYSAIYKTESIINWRTEIIDNKKVPVYFVLEELLDVEDEDNPFDTEQEVQYRILILEDYEEADSSYMVIYGDKLSFVTLDVKDDPVGVIIEDRASAKTQKLIFEKLWESL